MQLATPRPFGRMPLNFSRFTKLFLVLLARMMKIAQYCSLCSSLNFDSWLILWRVFAVFLAGNTPSLVWRIYPFFFRNADHDFKL